MNKMVATLGLAATLALPAMAFAPAAEARSVTLTTQLRPYGGNGAYLAIYLVDPQGRFHSTLRVAGTKTKYHTHLSAWARGRAAEAARIDGITGASVGSGRTLSVTVDIADALIDAGYQIRVDTAVEDGRDNPGEVTVPLTSAANHRPVSGRGYIASFKFDM
ncbi:DUF2271 domain-containing protein [Roseococcus sp. SDR]|uniref:DUF2271 domain-containing protein n=1 Tax=Roseococcus sp. SDR TaxID=2835532 RepID=UPI001BCAAFBA|nr:DUF2271 domain-containing protein [Roseococcus sp. SDR]MBS7792671.1 DUF2271 domain-containing protein [Roseococcus sp. SDR]MBV1847985.1 DUF2271 domain-containing protein [Roseococcus sp. SDR]